MSTAVVLAVMALFSMAFFFINKAAQRQEAERAEEYRKAASLRGCSLRSA